jgi:DOPA 4,5-dioxygenase
VNPARPDNERSKAYDEFPDPLNKTRRGGFDVHIYHFQNNAAQAKYARELHERIRRECTAINSF